MRFREWLGGVDSKVAEILKRFPFADVEAYETEQKIELMKIKVPEDRRNRGVGSEIIRSLQEYARSVGKPIVLRPEAERGHKADLERFYRGLGFVPNSGRNKDFRLSSPTSRTMYWSPGPEIGHRSGGSPDAADR